LNALCPCPEAKDLLDREKHGLSFEEAERFFEPRDDYLEICGTQHSEVEALFVAIGAIERGLVVIVYMLGSARSLLRARPGRSRRASVRADDLRRRPHGPGGRIVRLARPHSPVDEEMERDYWAEPQVTETKTSPKFFLRPSGAALAVTRVEKYLIALPAGCSDALR
jgi:uncharacterized DUF497 family protein